MAWAGAVVATAVLAGGAIAGVQADGGAAPDTRP